MSNRMLQDEDCQGIRLSGGRTESGGRIKWCTALDAVQTKVGKAVQWGMGPGQ